jgi:hypothetical protein
MVRRRPCAVSNHEANGPSFETRPKWPLLKDEGSIPGWNARIFILRCGKKIADCRLPGIFWSSHHVVDPEHAYEHRIAVQS